MFGFAVADASARVVFGSNTQIGGVNIPAIEGEGEITLVLQDIPFGSGNYLLSFSLHSADHRTNYHRLDHYFSISVVNPDSFEGVCRIPTRWEVPT